MDKTTELWQHVQEQLTRAQADRRHPWTRLVLTTLSGRRPQSRWVVYRGRDTQGSILLYTDSRSPKVSQIIGEPKGQLLLYNDRKKLQVRIDVTLSISTDGPLYEAHKSKAENRPSDYLSSKAPGQKGSSELGEEMHFALIIAQPTYYDVLQLGDPHLRAGYVKQENEWVGELLVP